MLNGVVNRFNPWHSEEGFKESSTGEQGSSTSHERKHVEFTIAKNAVQSPPFDASELDKECKDFIPFRYEFMTPKEISIVFIVTALSASIAIAVIVIAYVIKSNPNQHDVFDILNTISIMNVVWAVLLLSAMTAATAITFRRFKQTFNDLTFRQRMLVRQVISGVVISGLWGLGTFIQAISILSESCPLFKPLDVSVDLMDDIFGEALFFIFHWAAIDHIISRKDPTKLLSQETKGMIYIPSVLIIGLECALRVAINVDYLIIKNPYANAQERDLACAQIDQGTFTCAINGLPARYYNMTIALFVTQTISVLLIVVYCTIAWKRLDKESWHSHRSLNISLRLYIWNTLVVGCVYYCLRIVQFTTSPLGRSGNFSVNACSYLLVMTTASPEVFQLFAVWMLTRAYLFTPIPKSWRVTRPYYRFRITFLQTFAWSGGHDNALVMDSEAFWTQVIGDEKVKRNRRMRHSMLSKMRTNGMAKKFKRIFNTDAWADLFKEGDVSAFQDDREIKADPLLRAVAYGPDPQVVQSQPVFSFELMVKMLWVSKLVYSDGVDVDQMIDSKVKQPVGLKERLEANLENLEAGLTRGAKKGMSLMNMKSRRRFANVREGLELSGFDEEDESDDESEDNDAGNKPDDSREDDDAENKPDDSHDDLEHGVTDEPTPGFEHGSDVAMKALKLKNKYVFENEDYAVRCVVFHNMEERRIVVSFRGSKQGANFLSDAKFLRKKHNSMIPRGATSFERYWHTPMVHRGFLSSFVDSGIEEALLAWVGGLVTMMREGGEDDQPGGDLSVLVCGHSLGGALAQLCSFSLASNLNLKHSEIAVYTYGCPGLGNLAMCHQIEKLVPNIFNVVNRTDWVYYVGNYASRVFHPGIPVHINHSGDLVVRPTFVESSLNHFFWKESIVDHLFPSYQKSVAKIISRYSDKISNALEYCPTLIDYMDASSCIGKERIFEQNLELTKPNRRDVMATRKGERKRRKKQK